MRWLAWRLHGFEVRFAAGVAAVVAVLIVVSRIVLASGASRDVKIWATMPVFPVATLLVVAPALLGMFVGAPLVATELEGGTHRLAWAQSVSRRRWLLVHLGLVLGGSVAALTLAGGAVYWGLEPLFDLPAAQAEAPLQPGIFDAVAIVPAAYGAFAVALGVTLGALTRRSAVAMFLVLVVFAGVRVGIAAAAQPNYEPPVRAVACGRTGRRRPRVPTSSVSTCWTRPDVTSASVWTRSTAAVRRTVRATGSRRTTSPRTASGRSSSWRPGSTSR
jgi:hypothetical protein